MVAMSLPDPLTIHQAALRHALTLAADALLQLELATPGVRALKMAPASKSPEDVMEFIFDHRPVWSEMFAANPSLRMQFHHDEAKFVAWMIESLAK